MERTIHLYGEITGGVKRVNVDVLANGQVKDRQVIEGYSHDAVREAAERAAFSFADAYGINVSAIKDSGVLPYLQFTQEAAR